MEERQPVYDKKVRQILEMMRCMTRDDVAKELKYKDWRGMDSYMRRKNFRYDSMNTEYVPATTKVESIMKDPKSYAPIKVVSIITAFEEPNADPKIIAKQAGFKDHKDMAEYMTGKGYEWNVHKNNYIKTVGEISEEKEDKTPEAFNRVEDEKLPEGMAEYIPFIRFLYEKRDEIYQLISGTKEDGKIPRYALPGLTRTKAIYMNDMIGRLAGEFSREKNVTQREIVEAALIEYLQKYGYKVEIEALLKSS